MPKANTVDEILASFHVPAEKEAARITVELLRANALLREGRDGSDGLLDMQRHRDAWRRYAYGRGPRPRDFLDGNLCPEDRGPTAVLEPDVRARWMVAVRGTIRRVDVKREVCWCSPDRIIVQHGHTDECVRARAALRELAGAGEPAPVVDEPAPPASAPRRMVGRHKGNVSYTHAETVDCEGRCRPVEPPKVRRMRAHPDCPADTPHGVEHDETAGCESATPCQPVAPSSTESYCILCKRTKREGHAPNCGKPSSTEAAGPSPECRHDWIAVDGGLRCVKCKDTRASSVEPAQPPHVHQWAAILDEIRALGWSVAVHNDYRVGGVPYTFWLFTKDGRAVKGEGRTDAEALTAVREHCVADGCTEPPVVREVAP